MGDQEVYILLRGPVHLEGLEAGVPHRPYGMLEYPRAVHLDGVEVLLDGLDRGRPPGAATDLYEMLTDGTVRAPVETSQPPAGTLRGDGDRAGAVTEENARCPVGPVGDLGEHVRTYDQDPVHHTGLDECPGLYQPVDEPGTTCLEVVGGYVSETQPVGNEGSGAGERVVGSDRADDYRLDIFRPPPRSLHGEPRRFGGDIRIGGLIITDPALFDTGPRCDPFIRGIDDLLEVGVGQPLLRYTVAGTYDVCISLQLLSNLMTWSR